MKSSLPVVLAGVISKIFQLDTVTNSMVILLLQELDFSSINTIVDAISIGISNNLLLLTISLLIITVAMLIYFYGHKCHWRQHGKIKYTSYEYRDIEAISCYIKNNPGFFKGIKTIKNNDTDRMYEQYLAKKTLWDSGLIDMFNRGIWLDFDDKKFGISGKLLYDVKKKKYESAGDEKGNITNSCYYSIYICKFVFNTTDIAIYKKYLTHIDAENRNITHKISVNYNIFEDNNCITVRREIKQLSGSLYQEIKKNVMKSFYSKHCDRIYQMCRTIVNQPEIMLRDGNIPRVGYLLHGPPGTGKSSLPQKLSLALNRSIYEINFKNIKKEAELRNIFDVYTTQCIFVIDEFDLVLEHMIERKKTLNQLMKLSLEMERSIISTPLKKDETHPSMPTIDNEINIQSLLNIFQGAIPRVGLIIFATTNNLEYIYQKCPALVRPGRFTPVKMDYSDSDEINMMCQHYFNKNYPLPVPDKHNVPMSEITEIANSYKYSDGDGFEQFTKELDNRLRN